jgi:hypothetical protein
MWIWIAIVVPVLGLILWGVTRKSKFGHWSRITVTFLSGGFIFPHSLTENDEIDEHGADKNAEVKKQ